jgi:hypothetical protein
MNAREASRLKRGRLRLAEQEKVSLRTDMFYTYKKWKIIRLPPSRRNAKRVAPGTESCGRETVPASDTAYWQLQNNKKTVLLNEITK